MTTTTPLVRFSALAAPTFLLLYGLLRLVDGLDGDHGPGLAWSLGHALFLISFGLLGVLAVGMRHLVPASTAWTRVVASLATVSALFGVGCFLWVILGDLSQTSAMAHHYPTRWKCSARLRSNSAFWHC